MLLTALSGISKGQVSRLCEKINGEPGCAPRIKAFLDRLTWATGHIREATCLRGRRGGRIVPVAAIVAVGINADGRRQMLGGVGTPEQQSGPSSCAS